MTKYKPSKSAVQDSAKPSTPILGLLPQDWLHVAILTVVFWFAYNYIFNANFIDLNGDNFAYYLLGRNLAEGKGYLNYSSVVPTPHNHFPPAFPFLISIFIRLFDAQMNDIAFYMGVFMYFSVLMFYFTLNRIQSSKALSFVVAAFVALNWLLLSSATTCMSEIPFTLFSILGLFFLVSSANDNAFKSWKLLLSVAFFAACYYTKTIGVALFGAMFLYFLFSKKWKHLLVSTVAYVAMILPWYIRGKRVGSSYMGQLLQVNPYRPELGNLTFKTFLERMENNFVRYVSLDFPNAFFAAKPTSQEAPFSFWILGLGIIVLALLGISKLKDFKLFFLAYIGATFAILLAWPDAFGGLRFVEVLIPVFLFLMIYGIAGTRSFKVLKLGTFEFSPYWLLLALLFVFTPLKKLKTEMEQPVASNFLNYFELAKWAKENTAKDAVFSARKPEQFNYYSGRITINYVNSLDDKEVLDDFRKNGVDYVVLDQLGFSSTGRYLYPAITKNIQKFEVVAQLKNPDTYVLKFDDTK